MNIVITGASRGIGFSIAEKFAEAGHHILITASNEVKLYQAMEALQTRYPQAGIQAKAFDLAQSSQATALAAWCLEYGTPDILVNNAGVFEPGQISNEPEGALEHQLQINLLSAYHLTRALLPAMKEKKKGFIFNLCSVAALQAYPNGGAYSISKFALRGFSENLRHELRDHGIKVTALFPGAIMTDSWADFDNSQQRIMEARDIADLIWMATQLSGAACVENIVIRPQLGDL